MVALHSHNHPSLALLFRIVNCDASQASGTLGQKSTVTVDEMIEHTFYQVLNLVQIVYIHVIGSSVAQSATALPRLGMALAATSPWTVRNRFPVNHFSDNWKKETPDGHFEVLLYRIKKWQ